MASINIQSVHCFIGVLYRNSNAMAEVQGKLYRRERKVNKEKTRLFDFELSQRKERQFNVDTFSSLFFINLSKSKLSI